jgi:hypothetical protein
MAESHSDAFQERRKGMEEAFFKQRDQELVEKMRLEMESLEEKKRLAQVSGIGTDHVLDSLVAAGVRAETLAAVSLVPVVEVAWCDGSVSPAERDAVLNAAVHHGIAPDSAPYALLKRWLEDRPDSHVVAAWKDYVRDLKSVLPAESVAEMRQTMVDRATRVAEAAGGFLGINTISKTEQNTIDEFARVWDA